MKTSPEHPVAYFCAEYAISNELPMYAGGLGILAGDLLLEAASNNFPMVALGLRYKKGQNNRVYEDLHANKHEEVPLTLLLDAHGKPVTVSVPVRNNIVHAHAWKWQKNSVTLYLLDTDIAQNTKEDRTITHDVYVEDRSMRAEQEMMLGIGGYRLLETLGIKPSVIHLNEGHSAFATVEFAATLMRREKIDFESACAKAKKHIVFTNHTLVEAGQELFNDDVLFEDLVRYTKEIGVPVETIIKLGKTSNESPFSMTTLALAMSRKVNAVSALHEKKAREIWQHDSIDYVTNGIFIPRWDGIRHATDKDHMWLVHQKNKQALLAYINKKTHVDWKADTLLIAWARRLVTYKQPLALVEDVEHLKRIALKPGKEVRIVFSGPFDEHNGANNPYVHQLKELAKNELNGILVLLPNYSIELAQLLTAGSDVWANTPMVGREACGTSGMKAALNGSLPLSTKDGWVDEVNLDTIGWIADNTNITDSLLSILEEQIVPMYYYNESAWRERMLQARTLITSGFSATRMLDEYKEKLYLL